MCFFFRICFCFCFFIKNIAFNDFCRNNDENIIGIEIGKGDQLNYESNGFIWIPKIKYSSFKTFDFGKNISIDFNYGLKFNKFSLKLDSTNLHFKIKRHSFVVGIYKDIAFDRKVIGITYLCNFCDFFNFFFSVEKTPRIKYFLDKSNVKEWEEKKYGTNIDDYRPSIDTKCLLKDIGEGDCYLGKKYGGFNSIDCSTLSSGIVLKDRKNKVCLLCSGNIIVKVPSSVFWNKFFDSLLKKESSVLKKKENFEKIRSIIFKKGIIVRLLLNNIKKGFLDKIDLSFSYKSGSNRYSRFHNPLKFKINTEDYILPVDFIWLYPVEKNYFEEYKESVFKIEPFIMKKASVECTLKTSHNITGKFSLFFELFFMKNIYYDIVVPSFYDKVKFTDKDNFVCNILHGNISFSLLFPFLPFLKVFGGIGIGLLNKNEEFSLRQIFSLNKGSCFWNFTIGIGILPDKLFIKKNNIDVINTKEGDSFVLNKVLDRLHISTFSYMLRLKQSFEWGRNPYEYYRRGFSYPLDFLPCFNIVFDCDRNNKIAVEIAFDFNNKDGHGWEKENWQFKCIDKINFKWYNTCGLTLFFGYGETIVNNFTKVWRLGIKQKVSEVFSISFSIEKPRKSWKIQKQISIINEERIWYILCEEKQLCINTKDTKVIDNISKLLIDINNYKNCDDSFLTGIKHLGFSCSFDFNFAKDIFLKIGTMWKPFNENKDGLQDKYDILKGIIYLETKIKGFSLKCTLNRASGAYTQIENCNVCCHGFGFVPPEFCIGPDTYYQNSFYDFNEEKFFYLEKEVVKEIFKNKKYEEILSNNQDLTKFKEFTGNNFNKLKYIITLDFQIKYSLKIFKKREDEFFIRVNYLHCFTKYERICYDIKYFKFFYEFNFFKVGLRSKMFYFLLGYKIYITNFLKITIELCPFSGFLYKCVALNLLYGVRILFECDFGKSYSNRKKIDHLSILK